MNTHILGAKGEQQAKEYLIKNKYKILETNFTCPIGEIDIIAKKKDVIIFIEVKTRETAKYGLPREAVTAYKQDKIRKIALTYLKFTNNLESKVRFDCIDILDGKLTHLQNCF